MSSNEIIAKDNIWCFKQNKPSYVANDLAIDFGVPPKETYKILLKRGVFKWLAVRRDLIKLKNVWKERIKQIQKERIEAKKQGNHFHNAKLKGYLLAYEQARKEVRALCHSERWRAPDFDKAANKFLLNMEKSNISRPRIIGEH